MAQFELVQASMPASANSAQATLKRENSVATDGCELFVSHDIAELETLWRQFETYADLTVFQSFDWLSAWQQHIGSRTGVTPAIVVGKRLQTPLFILPLAIEASGLLRSLTFLGHDLGDYNAPILAPEFEQTVGHDFPALWQRIGDMLQQDPRHRHDLVVLDKMPERIGRQPNPFMRLRVNPNPSGAYATELAEDWASYYEGKRSGKAQRHDRGKRKHLGSHGLAGLVTATDAEDVERTVTTLIEQKQKSLANMGVANMFERPGYRDFYFAVSRMRNDVFRSHVCRLQVGDLAAATNLGLRFRDCYYYVLTSYDDGPISRFGPGSIQLQEIMAYAIAQGDRIFDFTIGDEPYKREWCEIEIKLYDHVAARTLRGRIMTGTLGLARRTKRAIKQSAWLWPLALKLRARLASLRR